VKLPASNYLAVDPGETSGWALLTLAGGFHSGELSYADMIENARESTASLAGQNVPMMLLCERAYASTKNLSGGALHSLEWELETIGCLKWITRLYGLVPLKIVGQSESKNFGTNELLERLGWWNTGHKHANDAARVLTRGVSEVDLPYWKSLVKESGLFDGEG